MSVNATGPIEQVEVTGDGTGVTNQAGTHLLGAIATRLGLAEGFSEALAETTERAGAYDRGRLCVQVAMMLAAGGRCLSDLKVLRDQPALFGQVASDPTAWRALHQVDDTLRDELTDVRTRATRRLLAATPLHEVTLDVDATLVDVDSETKQAAAPTFKGGFGFAPMACAIEPLGAVGGAKLRPGNATANDAADQLQVIDEAIACLPAAWRAGHHPGDSSWKTKRRLVVRGDTAACSKQVVAGLDARNCVFSVGMRTSQAAADLIGNLDHDAGWVPAVDADGRPRHGAFVIELPQLVPAWAPEDTRAILRRERAHPGASLRLWDYGGWRHQVVLTNDTREDIAALERRHRRHAQVENRIKNLKDTGLARLPFHNYQANQLWLQLAVVASLLLAALTLLVDDEELAVAEPRRLRYALLQVAARITHHARRRWLKLDAAWPWTDELLTCYETLTAIPAATG